MRSAVSRTAFAAVSVLLSVQCQTLPLPDVALGDPGAPDRWLVIHKDGLPSAKCSCQEPDDRKLLRVTASQAATDLLFKPRSGKARPEFVPLDFDDDEAQGWLEMARRPLNKLIRGEEDFGSARGRTIAFDNVWLKVASLDKTQAGLLVYTEPPIANVSLTLEMQQPLRVVYVCQADGLYQVAMNYTLADGQEMCFKWTKECGGSWNGFKIIETGSGSTVFEKGQAFGAALAAPSFDAKTFTFMHSIDEGTTRLKDLTITSSSPNLKAVIKGKRDFVQDETSSVISLGRETPKVISVVYECEEPTAESEMHLQITNEAPASPPISLRWKAACSVQSAARLFVEAQSCSRSRKADALPSTTVLMANGSISSEFRGSALTIAASDSCTAFRLWTEDDSPISLLPAPQLEYDDRHISISPRNGIIEHNVYGVTSLRIAYACLRDGLEDISLTIHVLARPSIVLEWAKACRAPTVRHESMWTADQILAGLMGTLLMSFLIFFFSRSPSIMRYFGDLVKRSFYWARGSSARAPATSVV